MSWLFLIALVLTLVLTVSAITEKYTNLYKSYIKLPKNDWRYINQQKRRTRLYQSYD